MNSFNKLERLRVTSKDILPLLMVKELPYKTSFRIHVVYRTSLLRVNYSVRKSESLPSVEQFRQQIKNLKRKKL